MTKTENVRPPAREQSRARYPDRTGYVERDGVRVFWEQYGDGDPAILFLPTWSIVHSRVWKAQIPYFARYTRVLTFYLALPAMACLDRPSRAGGSTRETQFAGGRACCHGHASGHAERPARRACRSAAPRSGSPGRGTS